jgi:cysteine desulfurase
MERIYLDNAAATPMDSRVLQTMMPYLTSEFGNPSSLHYFGQQARAAVQKARGQVAHCLDVEASQIVFTSGGTEADNLAVLGYLRANHPQGGHIITTSVEHQAILHTFRVLAGQGYEVTYLPVDEQGRVRISELRRALRPNTIFISVMYANNETGTIQPIEEIGRLAHEHNIVFHVDAVQAFGYIPLAPRAQHIDLLTVCSHKIYGPKGVGALYIRKGLELSSSAYGGPQEHQLRAGTENVAGIVGFGCAAALLEVERQQRCRHAAMLKQHMYKSIIAGRELIHLNGSLDRSLPNILDFSIKGIDQALFLIALDMQGIAVSAGSACEAGAVEPSHVLRAMGLDKDWIKSSIRISFGNTNTLAEIEKAVAVINRLAKNMSTKEEYHE